MAGESDDTSWKSWKGEHWSLVGPCWPGFNKLRHLIIFGDSYSKTNDYAPQPVPTEENPLGIPWPGYPYTERSDLPNWVGHLVKEHVTPLLVYNYAKNGHTVNMAKGQVRDRFMGNNAPQVPWTASDTLFVFWFGINDLAYRVPIAETIAKMFQLVNQLYEKGARNFLFIDVPPVNRSPAYRYVDPSRARVFPEWNTTLANAARAFYNEKLQKESASGNQDESTDKNETQGQEAQEVPAPASVLYFSSHKAFTSILNTPEIYGLTKETIWMDQLHPTSGTHFVLGGFVIEMLSGIPAGTLPAVPSTASTAESASTGGPSN